VILISLHLDGSGGRHESQANSPCLALLMIGCSHEGLDASPTIEVDDVTDIALSPRPGGQSHDLGPILTHGQTLHHEFAIDNPTGEAIRILRVSALTPCCSAVEDHPRTIAPHGKVEIPVVFRPGLQTGKKSVAFAVETDGALGRGVATLRLTASLFSEWEVIPSAANPKSFPLGKGGTLGFDAICRRSARVGLPPPDSIELAGPATLVSFDPAIEESQADGFIVARRHLEVRVPADSPVGMNHGSARYLWAGGESRESILPWEVKPRLQASPSAVVLKRGEPPVESRFLIASDDRPFRVVEVTGPLLEGPPAVSTTANRTQTLGLRIATARAGRDDETGEIIVRTDHPDQPTVTLRVLILDDGASGRETP